MAGICALQQAQVTWMLTIDERDGSPLFPHWMAMTTMMMMTMMMMEFYLCLPSLSRDYNWKAAYALTPLSPAATHSNDANDWRKWPCIALCLAPWAGGGGGGGSDETHSPWSGQMKVGVGVVEKRRKKRRRMGVMIV